MPADQFITLAKECNYDPFESTSSKSPEANDLKSKIRARGYDLNIKMYQTVFGWDGNYNPNEFSIEPLVRIELLLELGPVPVKKRFCVEARARKLLNTIETSQIESVIKSESDYLIDRLVEKANEAISDQISLLPYRNYLVKQESESKPEPESETKPESSTASNSQVRDKWALIVGISNFQDTKIPRLKYAAKDARDFREFLVNECNFKPDHVRLLLNEKATERRVNSELGNKFLARVAKPDDLTVLYFSTHGSASKADLKGKNYLVAYDSDREDLYTTGIEMQKIIEAIGDRIDSGRVLLILDACHSGATNNGTKDLVYTGNFDAEELALGSGKLVICSSKTDQQSWESSRYPNGVFTRKLIEGLKTNGKKTKLGDAFKSTSSAVKIEVQEDHAVKQEPVLRSKWNGNDLILAIPPASPQELPQSVKSILEADSSGN